MKSIWIGLTLIILAACGAPATVVDSTRNQAVVLNANTKVMGTPPTAGLGAKAISNTVQNIAELLAVSPDGIITFVGSSAYAQSLLPGDVIAAPPNQVTADGFLRKVVGVQNLGSQVLVYTEESDLDEAIAVADSEQEVPLEQSDIVSVNFANGASLSAQQLNRLRPQASVNIGRISIPLDNKLICVGDAGQSISGSGLFEASLKAFLKVKFGIFTVKEARAGITSDQTLKLNVNGQCKANAFAVNYPIAKIDFGTKVIWIGPFPVVIKPYVTISLGANGNITTVASFNITQTFSGTYGILWRKGSGLSAIDETVFNVTGLDSVSTNAQASLSLTAFVRAEAGFKFYGVASLYGYLTPYTEFLGTYTASTRRFRYDLYAGLKLGVGGRLKIFGKTLAQFDSTIIDSKKRLVSSTEQPFVPPTAAGTPTPPRPQPCGGERCQEQ